MDKEIKKSNQSPSLDETNKWIELLFFAYKKAKHFVTRETSFVNDSEIIQFESNLDYNIKSLADLLNDEAALKKEIKNMEGYLYFFPKSFGPNKQPRIRPKVTFPFKYQIIWAAVILCIGEWFDTRSNLKNVFSMRDENIRKELDWMAPWSFNGRLKRLTTKKNNIIESNYIQYNNNRLYESHQMALRKFNTYESKVTEELFKKNEKVYKAELDIQEFFPTLQKKYIREMFDERLDNLKKINCFKNKYFDPDKIKEIINTLLDLDIKYPDTIADNDPLLEILEKYYDLITNTKTEKTNENNPSVNEKTNKGKIIITKLINFINDKLPLDLIASNFISNCVLNHFVDSKISGFERGNISILRYTDDYTIISPDKEEIKNKVKQIKKKLECIDLTYSPQKTLPTTAKDVEEKLEYLCKDRGWPDQHYRDIKKWLQFEDNQKDNSAKLNFSDKVCDDIKTKLLMVGINIEPEEVSNENVSKDSFISKLSTASDIKLQALSDEELSMYIEELLAYMRTKGNLGELKEETIKIFAAWRLNSSHEEFVHREPHDMEDIREFLNVLEEALKKYPTKLGFYDVYIYLLLRVIEKDEGGLSELETFLIKIKDFMKESAKVSEANGIEKEISNTSIFLSSCFPTVRIRILNLISSNWKRFDKEKRKRLRTILQNAFLHWYAEPNVKWDELYVMYSSFFILRIRLPLDSCRKNEHHPMFLSHMAMVYNSYNFVANKGEKEEDNKDITPEIIMSGIDLLKRGLYWNRLKKKFTFNEVDELIYHNIKKHLTQIDYETTSPESEVFVLSSKLEFAKIAPEKLKGKDWVSLTDNWPNKTHNELIFEVLDFLQKYIQRFFERPSKYSALLDWIEGKEREDNMFKLYVKERFESFRTIRSYFSQSDERFPPLIKDKENNDSRIPIADWVFYCQTLPFHLEITSTKQRVLHPLTEYELVTLLDVIINCKYFQCNINKDGKQEEQNSNENNNNNSKLDVDYFTSKSHLFEIKMSPKQWSEFRQREKISCKCKKEKVSKERRAHSSGNKTNNVDNSTLVFDKERTEEIVKSLFSLLTNRPWHTHVRKDFSMYKWNDLQSYFEMTYYPSTAIASLFVNHLNIHQDFYSRHYNMPLEELPYRDVYTKEKSRDIVSWKDKYLREQKNKQVYKTDNRKLELLEIDIDQLRS